jgi:hypothetical protein
MATGGPIEAQREVGMTAEAASGGVGNAPPPKKKINLVNVQFTIL